MKIDLISRLKHTAHIWVPALLMVLCKLVFTGIALAHDCSTEADCLQTAGYNTVLGVGGGLIAILAALFGSHLGGAAGALTQMGEVPPDTGTKGATVETAPESPVIINADGDRIPNWSPEYAPGENGYEGKPGDVWYDGNWVDPDYARERIREQVAEDTYYDNLRDTEREAFWTDVQDASQQWLGDRHQQLEQEAAIERQENQSRQDAMQLINRIEDSALGHGYTDILQRAEENAWNPDGSINPDYVNRLRDALSNRIGRDIAAPNEALQQGWVGEALENTWNDARHNPLIRMGSAVLTGGTSEIYFQSQAAYEAMQRSYDEAVRQGKGDDWGYGDALWAGGKQIAEENLPVNLIKTVMDPNATTTDILLATGMDMLQSMDTAETIQNLRGSFSVVRGGGSAWDAMTHRADPIRFFPGEEAQVPTGPHDIDGVGGRVDVEAPRGLDDGTKGLDDGTRGLDDGTRGTDIDGRGRTDIEGRGEATGAPLYEGGGGRGLDDGTRGLDDGTRGLDEAGPTRAPDEAGPARAPDEAGPTRGADEAGPARAPDEAGPTRGADEAGPARAPDEAGPARGPDEGGKAPDEGGKAPDEGGKAPDEGGKAPDEGGKAPDEGGKAPDEGGKAPDEGTKRNVDELPPDTRVEPNEYGIPDSHASEIQRAADDLKADIEVRQTNPHSTPKLEDGYPAKPGPIKTKTLDELDEMLGGPKNHLGEAGYYEPRLPEGVNSYDELSPELKNRFDQRFEEYSVQGPKIQELEAKGQISIDDGGVVVNRGLVKNADGTVTELPFVGDHDVFKVTPREGCTLSQADLEKQVMDRLQGYGGGGHGSHMSEGWKPPEGLAQEARYNIANKHVQTLPDGTPGESLIKFRPNEPTVSSFADATEASDLAKPAYDLRDIEYFDHSTNQWTR